MFPASGQRGTMVTIMGNALFGGATGINTIKLASQLATVVAANNSLIIVVTRAYSITDGNNFLGDIAIKTNLTTQRDLVFSDAFTYLPTSNIRSVSPVSGSGGTYVTCTGENLLAHGTAISGALIVGVTATIVSFNTTHVVLQASASVASKGQIR